MLYLIMTINVVLFYAQQRNKKFMIKNILPNMLCRFSNDHFALKKYRIFSTLNV